MNARPLAILLAVLLCAAAPARAQVSPTTGAEVPSGRFLPVLVSVGHGYGTARTLYRDCLLYTSPSPRDKSHAR